MGLFLLAVEVHAKNSLGIGSSEQAIVPQGPFSDILYWIQQQQKAFYKSLTGSLKAIKAGEASGMWLVGLSFAYGVLHAAGPGHGKAVISMYMIANEVQLKRGVLLSFASAFLQALVAIGCISLLVLVLRAIGFRSADVTHFLEVCSYAAIMLLGLWLLYRKLFSKAHDHSHTHSHSHDHHDHPGEQCHSGCGHAHFPDPKTISENFDLRTAYAAVLAVGLRPCSGALIVLTFAFLNGIHFYGVLSAFAMAVGTGLTVSILASIAVLAKRIAIKLSGGDSKAIWFTNLVEIGGALLVFLLGLTLLMASLR